MSTALAPLAVYIHWPYCKRICPYCDFNVYKHKRDVELLGAIKADLSAWASLSGPREIISVHFGGGTPSLMPPHYIEQIIETVEGLWGLGGESEIAIEANPSDSDRARWEAYRAAGINRFSLGIQSFDDGVLKRLGRDHNGAQARSALEQAMAIFPSVSADMIFGHAGQSLAQWETEIDMLLALAPHHISAYQLTVEAGTAFAKAEARGETRAVDSDSSADLYQQVCRQLSEAGYQAYEVSNHAQEGHYSRHNLAYWEGLDYAGVGPGAHGRLTQFGVRYASVAAARPEAYCESVNSTGNGIEHREAMTAADVASEYVMMGLRIEQGISLGRYSRISGAPLPPEPLRQLTDMGLITQQGDSLFATAEGRLVLNTVSAKLLGA